MAQQEFTDAIALLKADHRTVEELFAKFENASGDGRKQAIEEEIFYPALEGKIEEDVLAEAYVEHDGAKVLVNDIMAGGPDDQYYEAKVTVLQEEIEHHVKEEEAPSEGMFSQARDTDVDLVALRDRMLARKEELKALAESEGLPPAELTAVAQQPA